MKTYTYKDLVIEFVIDTNSAQGVDREDMARKLTGRFHDALAQILGDENERLNGLSPVDIDRKHHQNYAYARNRSADSLTYEPITIPPSHQGFKLSFEECTNPELLADRAKQYFEARGAMVVADETKVDKRPIQEDRGTYDVSVRTLKVRV